MRYAMTMLVAAMVLASCAAGTKSYRCPDGTYVVNPTSAPPDCPTGVFNPRSGDALGDTSTNSLSNLTQTGGTAYSCVYLATATEPTCAQIIAGTDGDSAACVDTSSKSAASTSLEFNSTDNHTGLTASTNYKVSHCVLRNGKKSQAQASASFPTLAGAAPGGGDLTNAGVFVTNPGIATCSDTYNGLHPRFTSGANGPWCTIAKVNSAVTSVGANVYLESGGTWSERLDIDWTGTSDDWVEVHCFEYNGTNAETCETADTRPVIMGDLVQSQIDSWTVNWDAVSQYQAQIQITNKSYVHLYHIAVENSAGRGVAIKGDRFSPGAYRGFILESMLVNDNGFGPIVVENGLQDIVVRDTTISAYNLCELQNVAGGPNVSICSGGGWPGGIMGVRLTNASMLVENNVAKDGYGEGFNCLSTTGMIIRENKAYRLRSVGFYADACGDTVIENNETYWHNGAIMGLSMPGAGGTIENNIEDNVANSSVVSDNLFVRNNIVIEASGMVLGVSATAIANGKDTWIQAYGNTIVSSLGYGFRSWAPTANVGAGSEFAGNLVVNSASGGCNSLGGVIFDRNTWTDASVDADCADADDTYLSGVNPLNVALSSVDNISPDANPLTIATDLCIKSGSAALGKGAHATFDAAGFTASSLYSAWVLSQMRTNAPGNTTVWGYKNGYDKYGTRRVDTTHDFPGAVPPC